MLVGAVVQGGVGFGLGMIASPFLVWLYPDQMPGAMIMLGGTTALTVLVVDWRSLDLTGLGWALLGRLPGVALGAWLVVRVPLALTGVLVGLAVLAAVALQWSGRTIHQTPGTLVGAGFVSGTSGTVSGIGGPPLAMVYAGQAGPVVRATLAAYFIVGTATSLAALGVVGRLSWDQFGLAVVLVPALILGNLLALPLARLLDSGHTRRSILLLAGLAGALLVVTSLH
ncbi:MAG: sulfite exporter TauE/SafE family protein [Propioniciclava sp.]